MNGKITTIIIRERLQTRRCAKMREGAQFWGGDFEHLRAAKPGGFTHWSGPLFFGLRKGGAA